MQQAIGLKMATDQTDELESLFNQAMGLQDEAEQERTKKRRRLMVEKKGMERSLMGSETLREKKKGKRFSTIYYRAIRNSTKSPFR